MTGNTIRVRDIISAMNDIAPPDLAMEHDVIGLQVGHLDRCVRKVLLALDASPTVIQAAVDAGADMLITHHALLYRPLAQINTSTPKGRSLATAIRADLCIFNAHTNLDIAEGGVNDVLASRFALKQVEILDIQGRENLYKLVVYVPETHLSTVRDALGDAGAGHIGNYSHCSFGSKGEGSFLAREGADPYLGQVGSLELVNEVRLETIVPEHLRHGVWNAVRGAHPYEEVAHDWYPVDQQGKPYGIGRIGDLPAPMKLEDFAAFVRDGLGLSHIRFGGRRHHQVGRVAILGGSGSRWISNAIEQGADVLVTSDCDHHAVAEAWDEGLAVVDATHAAMELPVLGFLKERLQAVLPAEVAVDIADVPEDPFTWM